MELKLRKFTVTTDQEVIGLGYSRLKDEEQYIHCFTLFVFIILWTTPVKMFGRQTVKQINYKCVEINGKLIEFDYYSDVEKLPHIYYRNKLGTFIKVKDFTRYKDDKYVVTSPENGTDMVIDAYDVSIFHPEAKLEGYLRNNTFYVTRELSVG